MRWRWPMLIRFQMRSQKQMPTRYQMRFRSQTPMRWRSHSLTLTHSQTPMLMPMYSQKPILMRLQMLTRWRIR